MQIGYLHIGSAEHGIARYGRLLATEARQRSSLSVIEAEVVLTERRGNSSELRKANHASLVRAAQTLRPAEIVHLQYNRLIWGGGWSQLGYLDTFMRHCACPLVVTLHDIFYPPSSATLAQQYFSKAADSITLRDLVKAALRDRLSPHTLALQKVMARSRLAFVCTQEEARRLSDRASMQTVQVIPHFVETRAIQMSRSEARQALGLADDTVITLLGFIYSGKGHQLLVQALAQLPSTVKVVFAGGVSSGHEEFYQDLMVLAEKEGVRDRIRVTGYLSESELEQYLVATDLAVCPFRQTSASGSLSTWISAARPILASNIPQVAEYNELKPGAIKTFDSYTVESLTTAIQNLIPLRSEFNDPKVLFLSQHLSLPSVFDQHLQSYNSVLEKSLQTA